MSSITASLEPGFVQTDLVSVWPLCYLQASGFLGGAGAGPSTGVRSKALDIQLDDVGQMGLIVC